MKIFLDTADLSQIRRAADAGLIDGITTNPSLLSDAAGDSGDPREILEAICETVSGPISAEVVATDADDMVGEGRKLAGIADNIVVKCPLTEDGLVACQRLRAEGIKVNVTLCFSPTQALLAAKAGATYISPFIGRLDDISSNGVALIESIRTIFDNYGIETQILAASIRHPMHLVECAEIGADVATMPFDVIDKLIKHPLTDNGLEKFLADWDKLQAQKEGQPA